MAKCKLCKTNIPDGTEYCKNCLDKEKTKSNESYLDSLLSSVKNTAPTTESIYKKKSDFNDFKNNANATSEQNVQENDMFKMDLDDIEDFEQYDLDDDLLDLKDDYLISDTDLFGDDLSNIFSDASKDQENMADNPTNSLAESESEINLDQAINELSDYDQKIEDNDKSQESTQIAEDIDNPNLIQKASYASEEEISDKDTSTSNSDINESNNYDDNFDADINDLLNRLDSMQNSNEEQTETKDDIRVPASTLGMEETFIPKDDKTSFSDNIASESSEDSNQYEEEDDFLSLLNQISSDDPVADDVKAISDLMSGRPVEQKKGANPPSDVGEVFSDALKVVSNLNDPNINEAELLNSIPDKKSKKQKKNKKDNKIDKKKSNKEQESDNIIEKPKKSLFKRLFGNVEDENTKKKSANTLTDNKAKNKKSKKSKKNKNSNEPEVTNDSMNGNEIPLDKKSKKESKKDKKKDKKESKKKSKEIIQVIDEIDEDEGRINRLGASIVFIFFGLLALLLFVGSNAVSYTLSIKHATAYFDKDQYNEAYDEVYGLNIKDEDLEIYEKIKTVMFVNKQLNSYNNYYAIKKYPQALDSLLKGLKRYDNYIELATLLGIESDLDYVREQILAELKNEFKLSKKEALKLNKIGNMKEYSLKVYDIAREYQ